MESDLNSHQQKGVEKENLVGGLAYSIVHNYIQKVVGDKRIGNHIFFQGGVTNNRAVVSAFEKVTGKSITVPPHFDVTGAIGAAILARKNLLETGDQTRFKGFDVSKVPYSLDKFTCKACANQCEIRRIRIEGEQRPLFYGGRCERYEIDERKGKGQGIPNLFAERLDMLTEGYEEAEPVADKTTIGIPRGLMLYYQQFPFWRTFFEELGYQVVISKPSDRQLVARSLENLTAETCFPVEVMTGHVYDLFDRGVDYVFVPFVVNAQGEKENPTINYNCPWVQTYPFMIRGALRGDERENRLLIPTLHFRYVGKVLNRDLSQFMAEKFGTPERSVHEAIQKAHLAQEAFHERVEARGREVLSNLPDGKEAIAVMGRPYNTGDAELNLSLVEKLINLDVVPIPQDFLPLREAAIFPQYDMMCWPNGQRILAAAKTVAADNRLNAVYLGNFRCGPDSFISHYVREELKTKPYLQLEVDEHSADAGMITRIEAFLDSLRGSRLVGSGDDAENFALRSSSANTTDAADRTLFIPYMSDNAHMLAAASRSCGLDARVLPMQGQEELDLGRRYTSSRECFPMICTTGSFLKKIFEPDFEPAKASFFMPNHNGPCRFGQYNKLQDVIFRRIGHEDIKIVSPSNEDSYAGFSNGRPTRFRLAVIRGIVAADLLRKFQQERRPYEAVPGEVDRVYYKALDAVISSVEKGAHDILTTMKQVSDWFSKIELLDVPRKPVVAVVGEIFMRDNAFCSGFLVRRLEELGAETIIAPFREWITYSTYRWGRDSAWKGKTGGVIRSRIQEFFQDLIVGRITKSMADDLEIERDVHLHEMLELCNPYVHKDYDGDPPLAFGAAAALARQGISGVVNILPFTCMPGTLIASVSPSFRKDYDNIPWVNIAYDGQDDTGIQTRLQAFVHQATEFCRTRGLETKRNLPNPTVKPSVAQRDGQGERRREPAI
jgi:predicted nucleotide-binding protein (sugar kinase/HSP70/actin superfamily)